MYFILLILFLTTSAFAEDLKILKMDPANHFVTVRASSGIDDTDLRKYEILLDMGADVCELTIKKTSDREWEFSTEGCDEEKPITKNSRIYLELKEQKIAPEPPKKTLKRDQIGYNFSLYYNSASSYRVLGKYESGLNSGDVDIKGTTASGAPGITFGLTIPGLSIFEIEAGLGYEFARKIKSQSGSIGGTSLYDDFGGANPTFKFLFVYGNLRFYLPSDGLFLYAGYIYGFPSISNGLYAKMKLMNGLQGGVGYKFLDGLSGELGMRFLFASYTESGSVGSGSYEEKIGSFSLVGLNAGLRYEL